MSSSIKGQIRVGIIGAGLIGQAHSMMLRRIADLSDGARDIAAQAFAAWDAARCWGHEFAVEQLAKVRAV